MKCACGRLAYRLVMPRCNSTQRFEEDIEHKGDSSQRIFLCPDCYSEMTSRRDFSDVYISYYVKPAKGEVVVLPKRTMTNEEIAQKCREIRNAL